MGQPQNQRKSHNVLGHVLNGTAPHAASIGGFVFSSSVNGRDVLNGEDVIELRPQVAAAFSKMKEVLQEAGTDTDAIGLMTVNMANHGEVRDAVLDEWNKMFPNGQGPATHLLVPQGGFPKPNTFLGIQFVAKVGAKRRSFVVDGQKQIGNLPHVVELDDFVVVGSIEPTEAAGAASVFNQLEERLAVVGATRENLGYLRTYNSDRDGRAKAQAAFAAFFGARHDSKLPAYLSLVMPDMKERGWFEMSHAFAVKNSKPAGFIFDSNVLDVESRVGADIAIRGSLFFSGGISGLKGPNGHLETEPELQASRMYQAVGAALESVGAGFGNLGKVNMWLSGKPSKDLALIGWKKIFGTADQGARDKTPARTFLIHAQPALDDDVRVELELLGTI